MARPFLTAEWRHLAILNFEVDPAVLNPFVPVGTELDLWKGKALVSMVGFLFQKTRLQGIPIPFHQNFEEVNLRFYVRRQTPAGWRRAVVFIKELVPHATTAWAANTFYNENYSAVPMGHEPAIALDRSDRRKIAYWWDTKAGRDLLEVEVEGPSLPIEEGSLEEFITEHYWGYCRQRDGETLEYEVTHPRWRFWSAQTAQLECDAEKLYGPSFAPFLRQPPASSFVAEGSLVTVFVGSRLGGTVLYDDACGFCRRWVPFWKNTLSKRGFDIAPLQGQWAQERLNLPPEELNRELRLWRPDGSQVVGADVYRHVMRKIWWAFPFYLAACAPVLRHIFDWSYRTFAENRYRVSQKCGWAPSAKT